MRAFNVDARKKYQWGLEIDSPFGRINIAQIMKCTHPKAEFEKSVLKPAGTLHNIKLPGRLNYDDIKMERVLLSGKADLQIHQWFLMGGDPATGRALPPSQVKRRVDLIHLNDNGDTIERWKLNGAWICGVEGDDLEGSSDPFMEKATICYDFYERGQP